MTTDTPAAAPITAAPMDSYSPEDRAFYSFWYGHMLNDLMLPPLANISHATARYIWDAALSDAALPAWHSFALTVPPSDGEYLVYAKFPESSHGKYVYEAHTRYLAIEWEAGKWWARGNDITNYVTAWMMLTPPATSPTQDSSQAAASGVDALWVEEAMELARKCELIRTEREMHFHGDKAYDDLHVQLDSARDDLRTHLFGVNGRA